MTQPDRARLRELLDGWEARDAGDGLSCIQRGTDAAGDAEQLVGPIPYERAVEIEEFIASLLDRLDELEEEVHKYKSLWEKADDWNKQLRFELADIAHKSTEVHKYKNY